MIKILFLAGLIASLLLSFISSGMETALYRVSRVRMRIRSDQGDARASRVLRVLDRLDGMVTTILINNNIAAYAGTYFLTLQLTQWNIRNSELLTAGIITPLFFVLTESLPKQLAYSRADFLALELVRIFSAIKLILSPMVWILNRLSFLLRRLLGARGEANLSQSQRTLLLEYLNAGVAEHVLSAEQNHMAGRIMQLEGARVTQSMIPLAGIVLLNESVGRSQALAVMAKRHSSVALLTTASGVPTGMAVTSNSFIMNPDTSGGTLGSAAEKLERIGAHATIFDALALFRKRHARRALVINRNQIVGMITTQTVLDQVAGIAR